MKADQQKLNFKQSKFILFAVLIGASKHDN